jgi:hypothetical protein
MGLPVRSLMKIVLRAMMLPSGIPEVNRECAYRTLVDAFFVDDSVQTRPDRKGMGKLVAAGGLHVKSDAVKALESALDNLSSETGFPDGEEFKWSPEKKSWMRDNLKFEAREQFFLRALGLAHEHEATAIVAVEDATRGTASPTAVSAEEDVITLFLERAHNLVRGRRCDAIVVCDRPGGSHKDESRFLQRHLTTVGRGTTYAKLDRIALVIATDSHLVRLLQLADLVVASTVARVAGESRWSPPVFEGVKPLLRRAMGRAGGVGLKIQPDFTYANLYYWLLGDDSFWRGGVGQPMPMATRPYADSPDSP